MKKINFVHKIGDLYLIEVVGNKQKKTNWSENFQDKNYNISDYSINPSIQAKIIELTLFINYLILIIPLVIRNL